MMKRFTITFVLLLLLISNSLLAQDTTVDQESSLAIPTEVVTQDTLIKDVNHSSELNNISDIRSQFEKQNSTYSAPVKPGESLLRFVKKDHAALSEEALYWARFVRDASLRFDDNMTFQDTVIVNPLFMPLLFKGNILPKDLTFYDFSALKSKDPYSRYYKADSVFKDLERVNKIEEIATGYIEKHHPEYFSCRVN